ncbi:efflux transporter periplasmic adaptor subunit [Tamilnaduibacter salinus]|uniref:Efflux transporter periplasmic adaptor subunit n=1 Tax=Tamilnaduibacter salinus TaxID=1484056 RepID=A0A2A2I6D3_9GAMM|nr:efflux RND transporter periplasmic adaptor subunit [Tamilnaduibacter salinus]PAV26690.1 efflux transporter periplasmic adaptor subunit [Tamilnaduibacter salinus]
MTQPINEEAARPETGRAGGLKTALISLVILVVGIGLIWLIFRTEPQATRQDAARDTAMLVDVTPVTISDYRPIIDVMGRVTAAREVALSPRVGGQVIEQSDALSPGASVSDGETLARIDPADYQAALAQRRSELKQAEADLAIEQGQQSVAREEFQLMGDDIEGMNRALVLREPQLKQAEAAVQSAEAAVRQAELNLERTTVTAPFDAQVLSRSVTVGSQINAGETMARLVATDRYWVEATVPLSRLSRLQFGGDPGSNVRIRNQSAWADGQYREGYLLRLVGELDEQSRMARVLITVDDPLALSASKNRKPPLLLGSYVSNRIEGRTIENVARIDRDLVRRNETVWVMQDGALSIRDVNIVFRDGRYAYIDQGLNDGDRVVSSDLATVVEGAALRVEASDS